MSVEPTPCEVIAEVLREDASPLMERWVGEVWRQFAFDLRPHVDPADPWIVRGIADLVAQGDHGSSATIRLTDRAVRLGERAATLDIEPEQVLKRLQALRDVLLTRARRELIDSAGALEAIDLVVCLERLQAAVTVLVRAITDTYFRRYRARIERDTDRLRGFNRMVSHELKGAVSALHGAAMLLSEEAIADRSDTRARQVAIIRRNAATIDELLDDLLALTATEMPDESIPPDGASVADAVQRARDRLESEATERGVRIAVDEPLPRVPVPGRALDLVLGNLIKNGVRYADREEPDPYVLVHAWPREEGGWTIAVEDNGRGIPDEAKPRVFERFYRAAPDVSGTGLGLGIVRELVEGWNGRIWFESTEGVGTTFFVTVPAAADAQARAVRR